MKQDAKTQTTKYISTTKYQEIPLSTVMKYFADGFTMVNGEKFVGMEWFIDTIKQKAIFRIDIDQPEVTP